MSDAAKRYGESLFELAREERLDGAILEELRAVQAIFAGEPDYLRLLASPRIPQPEKHRLLEEAFRDRVHPYTLNFLRLLSDRGLLREFSGCVDAYRAAHNEAHHILEVRVISAVPLREEVRRRLIERLETLTGDGVELKESVDPAILGGLRLELDGKRYDGTVQRRLESLRGDILSARGSLQ